MADYNIINGADMMLYVGGKSIGAATNHVITLSTAMMDTTAPGHKDLAIGSSGETATNWGSSVPQTRSWTCSSENLFADNAEGVTYDDLCYYWLNSTEIQGTFYTEIQPHPAVPTGGYTPSNAKHGTSSDPVGSSYLTGNMYITSLTMNAPYEGKANFSVEFQGTGPLTKGSYSYSYGG